MEQNQWCRILKDRFHVLFPSLCFIFLSLYCFRFFVDDTYINFIAAKNFIELGRLSANLEHNVNPTTANFHMLFSALIYAVTNQDFLEPVLKICGIVAGVLSLVLLNKTLVHLEIRQQARFVALTFLATAFPFILWTASAMDTVFDALILTLCCYYWFQDLRLPSIRKRFLLAAFFLVLARLDFAIISVILVAGFTLVTRLSKRTLREIGFFYILPLAIMMLSLKFYYGTVIPTPIQKASLGIPGMIQNFLKFGGLYFLHFCLLNLNVLSVVATGFVTLHSLKKLFAGQKSDIAIQLAAAGLALMGYICYIISQGSVHMMFAFRFYTPLLPALFIFFGYGLHLYILQSNRTLSRRTIQYVIGSIIALNISTFFYGYYKNLNFSEIPGGDFTGMKNNNIRGWILLHEEMRHAGIYFGSLIPPGSKVFLGVAGIIPYFMDRNAYDNGLLGAPTIWKFDYVLNGCSSVHPVPKGFIRHQYKTVSPDTLYYPNSSWCLRQLQSSTQPRLINDRNDDRLSRLPIHDVTGFEGILDMAGDTDARYFAENKMWDELVDLLNQLNSLSDTSTGKRELTGYGQFLPAEYKSKLTGISPASRAGK
jgi:hypothetical protein